MLIINTVQELRTHLKRLRQQNKSIGLVPTMGALHAGHASLIAASSAANDVTVVSIFVNPTQFGPNEDLDSYPRTLQADAALASSKGANILFAPSAHEMYPGGTNTWVEVLGSVSEVLCGAARPGHFRGVTTVVSKLFNIVAPDKAYFGQKDAQQVQVLRKMQRDLMFDLEIIVMPIVREADGLALSSRNTYLSREERRAALVLSQSLDLARSTISGGEKNIAKIITVVKEHIAKEPLAKTDYALIYQLPDLTECSELTAGSDYLLALAVFIGKTRLIDNTILEVK